MKSTDLHIRKALVEDAPALEACVDAAYQVYAGQISDLPSLTEGLIDDIINNQVWLGVEGENVIAGLVLVPSSDHLKVANIAVHPEHNGKGVGRKLMEHSEKEAKRQGFGKMRLNTHIAMPKNILLYQYWGWQETARSGNTVSMKKALDEF